MSNITQALAPLRPLALNPAFDMELYLIVGDTSTAGAIDLAHNEAVYRLPIVQIQSESNNSLTGGIQFPAVGLKTRLSGTHFVAPKPGDSAITFGLLVSGRSGNDLWANWRAIDARFEQARRASGPVPLGTGVVLAARLAGSQGFAFWDVLDAELAPVDLGFPDSMTSQGGLIQLTTTQFSRGTRLLLPASSVLSHGGNQSAQALSITGGPTGGSFTLSWNGLTTAALPWSASAGRVVNALGLLTGISSTSLLLRGQAQGMAQPLYQFSAAGSVVQAYSTLPYYVRNTTGDTTTVAYSVSVKDGTAGTPQTVASTANGAAGAQCGLTLRPEANGAVVLRFAASGVTTPVYTVFVTPPGGAQTQLGSAWVEEELAVWDETGAAAGTWTFTVEARAAADNSGFRCSVSTTYTPGQTSVAGLSVGPANLDWHGQDVLLAVTQLSLHGSPRGGSFQVTVGSARTGPVAWNATAAQLQAALTALPAIGTGAVTVTGPTGGPWSLCWTGALAAQSPPGLSAADQGLVGASVRFDQLRPGGPAGPVVLSFGQSLTGAQPAVSVGSQALTGGSSPSVSLAGWSSGALWVPNVPGDTDALARFWVTDVSTSGVVQRLRLGRRSLLDLTPSEVALVLAASPLAPGVAHTGDATALRGTCARLTLSQTMQLLAQATGPTTGRGNGLYHCWARLRDASAPPTAASGLAVSSVTGFQVAEGLSFQVTLSPGGATQTVTNTGTASFTGLTNGTAYTATITPQTVAGNGPISVSNGFTPEASGSFPNGVPGSPTGVSAQAGVTNATVSWSAPASNGGAAITGYTVTASPGGATATTSGALTATVTGLTNGTAYTFTVKATNSVGNSGASAPSLAVVPAAAAGPGGGGSPGSPMFISGYLSFPSGYTLTTDLARLDAIVNNEIVASFWTTNGVGGAGFLLDLPPSTTYGAIVLQYNGGPCSYRTQSGVTSITFTAGGTISNLAVTVGGTPDTSAAPPVDPSIAPIPSNAVTGVQAIPGNASATVLWNVQQSAALTPGVYSYLLAGADSSGNAAPPSAAISQVVSEPPLLFFDDYHDGTLAGGSLNQATTPAAGGTATSTSESASATVDAGSGIEGEFGVHLVAKSTARTAGSATTKPSATASYSLTLWNELSTNSFQWKWRVNAISTAAAPVLLAATLSDGTAVSLSFVSSAWQLTVGALSASISSVWAAPIGTWHTFELTATGAALNLQVDGAAAASLATTALLQSVNFQANVTNPLSGTTTQACDLSIGLVAYNATFIGQASTVSVINTVNWTPGANLGSQTLYWTRDDEPYRAVSLTGSASSYTHNDAEAGSVATLPAPTAPAVGFAQVQALAVLGGTSQPGVVAQTQLGASAWEDVYLGVLALAPVVTPEAAQSPPWRIALQAQSGGTNTPTLDVDALWLIPADGEAEVEVSYPGQALAQQAVWQIDVNRQGYVSALLLSKTDWSVLGQADVHGQLPLGVGQNAVVVMAEGANGASDVIHSAVLVQPMLTPRYRLLRGEA